MTTQRFVVRRSVIGGWYVLDKNPGTYSRVEGTNNYFRDTSNTVPRNKRGDYIFRTYEGAVNFAQKLNDGRVVPQYAK